MEINTLYDPNNEFGRTDRELMDMAGYLPGMVASWPSHMSWRDWANMAYAHGGGWDPSDLMGGKWQYDPATRTLTYPGDPSMDPILVFQLHGQEIILYPHAWVAHVAADGTVEVDRMD